MFFWLSVATLSYNNSSHQQQYPWQDPSLPVPIRVESLISLLTVDEKASLLSATSAAVPRIGLPAYNWGRECERGDVSGKVGTAYPTGLALAASFDVALVEAVARQTAVEVRGNVNTQKGSPFGASCFGPVSNLIRDSRWGRTSEMITGEDPTLGKIMSAAFTRGMQMRPVKGSHYRMVNTIAKHLNTYAGPEGWGYTFGPHAERFNFEAKLTEREWREFFLPPFRGSAEAGVSGFMCSYSSITLTDHLNRSHNAPACANSYLLTDIIRKGWGWDGFILSDAGAVAFIGNTTIGPPGSTDPWHLECPNCTFGHGFASNASDAAVKAVEAGMDIELTCCGAPAVFPTLGPSVRAGRLREATLDRSLRRTLPVRFELGQLDPEATAQGNPYNAQHINAQNVSSPQQLALALRAALRSVVLLKNAGQMLPLLPARLAGKGVCVIGPNANDTLNLLGGYVNQHPKFITTIYEGIQQAYPQSVVHYSAGCNTTACPLIDPAAIDLASSDSCSAVIMALGLTADARAKKESGSNACGCPHDDSVEGECCDRAGVQLPGQQLPLLKAVAAKTETTGKPLVLLTVNAGMLDLSWAMASASVGAVINSIYQGQTTGTAIGRTINGASNPAGRLPISYYKNISQLGTLRDYNMHSKTYRYSTEGVILPFGFGLGFSAFQYALRPSATRALGTFGPCDPVPLSVSVTNKGEYDGDEVVQVYLSIKNASVTVPNTQLVAFSRVAVPAKMAGREISFTIRPDDQFVMRDPDFVPVVEPGLREVWVGGSSDPKFSPGVRLTYEITGHSTLVSDCEKTED